MHCIHGAPRKSSLIARVDANNEEDFTIQCCKEAVPCMCAQRNVVGEYIEEIIPRDKLGCCTTWTEACGHRSPSSDRPTHICVMCRWPWQHQLSTRVSSITTQAGMIDADDDEQGAQDAPCLGLIRAALNAEGIASGKSYRASASHQPQGKLSDTFVVGLAEREESAQRSDSAAGALQDGKPQPGSDTAEMHHCVVSHGGSKAANHRSDTGITSRCGTPQPKEGVTLNVTQHVAVPNISAAGRQHGACLSILPVYMD